MFFSASVFKQNSPKKEEQLTVLIKVMLAEPMAFEVKAELDAHILRSTNAKISKAIYTHI